MVTISFVRSWRWRRESKQKRGKQAGVKARLQADPHRPALSGLFLMDSRSLINKMAKIKTVNYLTMPKPLCDGNQ